MINRSEFSKSLRWLCATVASLVLLAMVSAGQAKAVEVSTASNIMKASAAMQSGDCAEALEPLTALWDDQELLQSDPELAQNLRIQRIVCTAITVSVSQAIALSSENVSRAPVAVRAYDLHMYLLLTQDRYLEAADTLDAAITADPSAAKGLSDLAIIELLSQAAKSNALLTYGLLGRLQDIGWEPHKPGSVLVYDILRLEGVRRTHATGEIAREAAYREAISRRSGLVYMLMMGDGAITPAQTPARDVREITQTLINDYMAYVGTDPRQLGALSDLVELESRLGQENVALTQLGGVLGLVAQYGLNKFQDPMAYPRLRGQQATLLANQGRFGDAETTFAEAATLFRANPGFNAGDFWIDYINFKIDTGDEMAGLALEVNIDLTLLTPQQRRRLAGVEACAYGYLGDKVRFDLVMQQLAPYDMMRIRAYACANDMEAAANTLKAMMSEARGRDQAIVFMQQTRPALAWSSRDQALIDRLKALRERADVRAAAEAEKITVRTWDIKL